ncbi:MAG: UDP-N-acetylmuramoyl-tripeptide--D-alanyl-D-alanine ligase, partial [Chloroflexi bacterium]|nr:UDP-N-acetylmuramoyl-tripeptide--D-alanyl-D-alanine ligase [Chloroflexota bacterium]
MLIFAELLTALVPGAKTTTEGTLQIRSVCIDSRQAVPGSLFVALRGERTDGHRYVGQAFAQGAVAALVEHPPEEAVTIIDTVRGLVPSEIHPPLAIVVADSLQALQRLAATRREARPDLTVVGVTGSVGKTTTKEALAAVLAQRAQTLKSAGNYNNEIGLPLTLLELQPVHRFAVLEMGMYALGEIALLCSIARPQVGVVTNVEPVHLERLGTIERIAMAKAELIGALPQDGVAVLNGDDLRVRAMAERTMARTVTFGLGPENDVRGEKIVGLGWQGIELTVQVAEPDRFGLATSQARLRTPMIGRHAAWPALAATATGLVLGLSWEEIARGLGTHKMNLRLVPKQGIGGV